MARLPGLLNASSYTKAFLKQHFRHKILAGKTVFIPSAKVFFAGLKTGLGL